MARFFIRIHRTNNRESKSIQLYKITFSKCAISPAQYSVIKSLTAFTIAWMHMHLDAHACMHLDAHACTWMHIHFDAHTRGCTYTSMHMHALGCTCTWMHMHALGCTYTWMHMHLCAHTLGCTCTQAKSCGCRPSRKLVIRLRYSVLGDPRACISAAFPQSVFFSPLLLHFWF